MNAILLCAGFATRMYPLTRDFPKPLLPVAGKPVLDYFMEQLLDLEELNAIHVVTNARFWSHFQEWRADWLPRLQARDLVMHLHNDGTTDNGNRLGAIRDLELVLQHTGTATGTLVAAGDNIFRFAIRGIWQDFLTKSRNVLVAIYESDRQKLQRTGVLELAADDRVLRLHEKPQEPPSHWSCPAIYFLQPTALARVSAYLQESGAHDAPGHFIAYLVQKEPVYAHKTRAGRFDIGSMASFEEADQVLQQEPVLLDWELIS